MFKPHPKAPNLSDITLNYCINYLNTLTNIKPKNVFEIGANFFQDAQYLKHCFQLSDSDIFVFEPHPQIFKEAFEFNPQFNAFEYAVSNKNEEIVLQAVDINCYSNNGVSSLLKHKHNDEKMYFNVKVKCIRMDAFLMQHNINEIDFLKLDVEGLAYEALDGFGSRLKCVKAIQVETEFAPVWGGQKTFHDVYSLLTDSGFQLIDYKLLIDGNQADSFWIKKELVHCKIFSITEEKWHDVIE